MLRPLSGSGGDTIEGVSCTSWQLGVETNNVRGWKVVPASCEGYVGHYMLGDRYCQDSAVLVAEAIAYAEALALGGDGKDVWVFDVDETLLSSLPYYALHGFGAEPFNSTLYRAFVMKAIAPPLPESMKLYNKVLSLGIKVIVLTGRREDKKEPTIINLRTAGFHTYEKLIVREQDSTGNAVAYKSGERKKLEQEGYRIVGNIGDQWSDILGAPEGARTFKLPDPMYYIG